MRVGVLAPLKASKRVLTLAVVVALKVVQVQLARRLAILHAVSLEQQREQGRGAYAIQNHSERVGIVAHRGGGAAHTVLARNN